MKSSFAHIDRSLRNGSTFDLPMKSVKEICLLTGVTRKTLFYYDRIGLLKPTMRIGTQGHKYYDEQAVETLLKIRLYKECGLKISEIRTLIQGSPDTGRELMEAGIQRLENSRTEISDRIFLARLLQLTGAGERAVRILPLFSAHEIRRIGMDIEASTCLKEEIRKWKEYRGNDPEGFKAVLRSTEHSFSLKLTCLIEQEKAETAETDREESELIGNFLQEEEKRYSLSEREKEKLIPQLQWIGLHKTQPADNEQVQLAAETIAVMLADQGREEALHKMFEILRHAGSERLISPYAEAVLWIFWLRHAFERKEENE